MRHKTNFDRENKKLNRNAYYELDRGLLCNTWLRIKTFTNQNLHFSMSSFFQKKQHNAFVVLISYAVATYSSMQ